MKHGVEPCALGLLARQPPTPSSDSRGTTARAPVRGGRAWPALLRLARPRPAGARHRRCRAPSRRGPDNAGTRKCPAGARAPSPGSPAGGLAAPQRPLPARLSGSSSPPEGRTRRTAGSSEASSQRGKAGPTAAPGPGLGAQAGPTCSTSRGGGTAAAAGQAPASAACRGPRACLPQGGPEASSAPGRGQAESREQTRLCHSRTGKCTRRPFRASTRVSATGQYLSPDGLTAWALGHVSHKPRPKQQVAQQHGPGL